MKKTRKKTYVGWIFAQKEPGHKDYFSVQYAREGGGSNVQSFGYGETAAAAAVDFFEKKHGPVSLEQTPIGLRVFIKEEESAA